jgi:predicted RecA/RadA family phage recombinase
VSEAIKYQDCGETLDYTPTAAITGGEVVQMFDGRAGVILTDLASGAKGAAETEGVFRVAKTASQVWIQGGPLWWDHSANAATCNEPVGAGDRDFFLGTIYDDALSAATEGYVNLNVQPRYIIDSARDDFDFNIIKTVVGSTTVEVPNIRQIAGMTVFNFGTTAEAQTVSMTSERSFALASNWVVEILLEIATAPDAAAVDIDVGAASAAGTTDFEAVAEFAAFHLDGDDNNIDAHSDDGSTDIAPTDTTLDWATGTPVRLTLDGRVPGDVLYYVDGVEVLNATANLGKLTAAAGPLFANIIAEKSADDSPLVFKARIRVRTMQEDAQV